MSDVGLWALLCSTEFTSKKMLALYTDSRNTT